MAKAHRSKPSQIRFSASDQQPHELSPGDWFDLVESGAAKIESDTKQARIATLQLPFVGWIENGQLCISRITRTSIKSTWLAFVREWLLNVSTSELQLQQAHMPDSSEPIESYLERADRVQRELETALFIEALEWKSTRNVKGGQNSIRWVSLEHYREMAEAFGKPLAAHIVENANASI